jgi:hypothetical protein
MPVDDNNQTSARAWPDTGFREVTNDGSGRMVGNPEVGSVAR